MNKVPRPTSNMTDLEERAWTVLAKTGQLANILDQEPERYKATLGRAAVRLGAEESKRRGDLP